MWEKFGHNGGNPITIEKILEMEEFLLLKREVMISDLVSVCGELRTYHGFTDDELREEYDEWLLRDGGFADHLRIIELFYELVEEIIRKKDE